MGLLPTAAADVTICIPAWQAEPFIDRTLACARAQTHAAVRIVVSVDASSDRTLQACLRHADEDARVEVIAQRERLGWSRNANFLLARVVTEWFFLYFHDDIIAPTYTEKLLRALRDRPDAMSIHCDLERFGNQTAVDPGNDYVGSPAHRLLGFLVGPIKGTPLRSLTRTALLDGGLRFAEIGTDGFWRCHPFVLTLLAAGPALRYPEVLYRRWFRDGSLTTFWSPATASELIEGQRQSALRCRAIIDGLRGSDDDKQLVRYALRIFILTWTREVELPLGNADLIDPLAISPAFADAAPPRALDSATPEVQEWLRRGQARLEALEATHAQRHGRVT